MKRGYRAWSLEEKRAAVARMESMTHGLLAAELGVEKRVLYNWRKYLRRLMIRPSARAAGSVGWSARTGS
jgi:transposase-like protein